MGNVKAYSMLLPHPRRVIYSGWMFLKTPDKTSVFFLFILRREDMKWKFITFLLMCWAAWRTQKKISDLEFLLYDFFLVGGFKIINKDLQTFLIYPPAYFNAQEKIYTFHAVVNNSFRFHYVLFPVLYSLRESFRRFRKYAFPPAFLSSKQWMYSILLNVCFPYASCIFFVITRCE